MAFKFSRQRQVVLGVLAAAAFAACAGGRAAPVASPADLERGTGRFQDLTVGDLAQGRSLFANRCGSCHRLPVPSSQKPEDWPVHIDEMRKRARLDDRQAALVERYLVTMALTPPASSVR